MKHGQRALWLLIAFAALMGSAEETTLIEFQLDDQFGVTHRHTDVAGRIIVMIGSDGDGSVHNAAWGEAIHNDLADHANYSRVANLPLADLRSVPFFAKGFARNMMPETPAEWVLMDWKGKFPKAYEFVEKASNILVFDGAGRLAYQGAGLEPDPEMLSTIVTTIRKLLDQPAVPES